MSAKMKLPIGVENFEEIRTEGFYYVDKTSLITELLSNWGKVNLFTRPRRFGKSLNMSMLKSFFEPGMRKEIFEGLAISKEEELCERYMGKFPVISISLKGVDGEDFDGAKEMLRSCIGSEAQRFSFLRQSDRLTEDECRQYKALAAIDDRGIFAMPDALLSDSLLRLSQLLCKYYGQKVIILIDEYDVPLDKAYQSGYYDAMVRLLRGLFIQTLKGNDSMYFAVLTGCLRISKESIFTGLNNLKVLSITDVKYNEYFGFTDSEVRELLEYYGLEDAYGTVKEWYDGYRFGNVEVYCPWDVINYCYDLRDNLLAAPQNYWANTSSNDIVKKFIKKAKAATKREIEELVAGRSVKKEVIQELTYYDLDSSVDNLWSILFTTGYLTRSGVEGDAREKGQYELVIPNKEIHRVFVMQVQEWFKEEVISDDKGLRDFCMAFQKGDAAAIEEQFNAYLRKTISIRDTYARKERKENFYHGILLGMLGYMESWDVSSNAESGEGYSDILIEVEEEGIGIVIEIKYAENGAFEAALDKAVGQIERRGYAQRLLDDGMQTVLEYGIACYKKHCKVMRVV